MHFNFYTGNHDPIGRMTIQDMLDWFTGGLEELGHQVTQSADNVYPDAINMIWENFHPGMGDQLRAVGIRYGIIATEVPDLDLKGFNNRSDEPHWRTRFENFADVAKSATVIWSMVEGAVDYYRQWAPTAFMELGFTERMVTIPEPNPQLDFSFFGIITPYRLRRLEELSERGVKVAYPGQTQTAGVLSHADLNKLTANTKVGLTLKQDDAWTYPSQARIGRLLMARCGIAAEWLPLSTPLSRLAPSCPQDQDFADYAMEILNGPWRANAEEAFERYRTVMPMRDCVARALDAARP